MAVVSERRGPRVCLVFSAVYVLAAFAGRLTIIDGASLSLVWPAAGVAVLWWAARGGRASWADRAALGAATYAVNVLTGAPPVLAGTFVAANLVQVGVVALAARRLLPELRGFGGDEPLTSPRQLWRLLAATVAGTACGALVGPTVVSLVTGAVVWWQVAVWMARNTTSIFVITSVGLVLAARVRGAPRATVSAPRAEVSRRPRWLHVAEAAALCCLSLLGAVLVFGEADHLPLAFVLIGFTVWAGSRFSPAFTAVHDLVLGMLAVVFTLRGSGPFAGIPTDLTRALVAQVFVVLVAVIGLVLATSRAELAAALVHQRALVAELRRAKDAATDQAELLSTVLSTMTEGVALYDAAGTALVRNPAVGALMGGLGTPDGRVADPEHYGLFTADGVRCTRERMAHARALAGEHVDEDYVLRRARTGERTLAVRATPLLAADGSRQALLVFSDVTAERTHRTQLATFAGVVAHDLRNPLAAIEGWADVVADTMGSLEQEVRREELTRLVPPAVLQQLAARREAVNEGTRRIQRSAARMGRLIDDLLLYATARDARLDTADIDLTALLATVVAERTDAVAAGGPRPAVHVGDVPPVHADAVLVRQLLDNLIGNALKYTRPGAAPDVTVRARGTGDGWVRVEVADRGIGIPEGQQERVFEDFHRAHASAGYHGTGLGLAICRRITERHGGTIAVTDNPGGGSCFTFTLPAAVDALVPA